MSQLNLLDDKTNLNREYLFCEKMNVRMSDLNYANHLDFSSIIKMMGDVRALFFKKNGYHELDIGQSGIITTDVQVSYKRECHLDDELEFRLRISRLGRLKINLIYKIEDAKKGEEVANGVITIAFYDYVKKKPVAVPREFLVISNLLSKE